MFLFPSTYDTNGIVVREAAACGLASVLIQGSCAAEGITHGKNGYLIEETAESMASLLLEVGNKLDVLDKVGLCAMEEIYISWDDSVRAAYERYQTILTNGEIAKAQTKEEQMGQNRKDTLTEFGEESKTRVEWALEKMRTPVNKMEDVLDELRCDLDTMLGNAMQNVDERIEEMHQRYERIMKWRSGTKDSQDGRAVEHPEKEEDE